MSFNYRLCRTKRIQTKYTRISILLLSAYIEKTTENKSQRHVQINLKARNEKIPSPSDEIIYGAAKEIKTKVENQKDRKNEPIILR